MFVEYRQDSTPLFKNVEIGKSEQIQAEIDHVRIFDVVFGPAFD